MNNVVNVLRQSPIFNDLKSGRASNVPFMANNVPYKRGYYLSDGIYPQWAVLIKSIKNPATNDHKRLLYKTKHKATRKDVERAFGVLKTKWKLIKYPTRGMSRHRLSDVMYTCIILHNMIIHDNGEAISPDFFPEEQHRDGIPRRRKKDIEEKKRGRRKEFVIRNIQAITHKFAHLGAKGITTIIGGGDLVVAVKKVGVVQVTSRPVAKRIWNLLYKKEGDFWSEA
ncbi:ALP1-like protein [Tanacetum coccineum]